MFLRNTYNGYAHVNQIYVEGEQSILIEVADNYASRLVGRLANVSD
jgi:hypothetical protein